MAEKRVRRRRDGIYFRQWDQSWYSSVTGKQLPLRDAHGQKIKGRHNEAAAKRAYAALLLTGPGAVPNHHPATLDDVFVDYLIWLKQTRAKSTYCIMKMYLEHAATAFGGQTFAAYLQPDQVARWLEQSSWAPATRNLALKVLKAAFTFAVRRTGRLTTNPIRNLSLWKTTPREEIFTDDQLARLFSVPDPPFVAICRFLLATGCRPGEAVILTAHHFRDYGDYAEFVLAPTEHKTGRITGKPRHIFLNRELTAECRHRVQQYSTGPIFRTRHNRPWQPRYLYRTYRKYADQLGIPKPLVLHSFRHTFATRKIDQGVPIARVAMWLGDTIATVERTYWHAIHRANARRFDGLDDG